jgi:hypothetical protein
VIRGSARTKLLVFAAALTVFVAPQTASGAGSGSFTSTGSMANMRSGPAGALLPDGRVLVAGGYGGSFLQSAEAFIPASGTFSSAGIGPMTSQRSSAGGAPLADGRVVLAGGLPLSAMDSAEIFNPTTGGFTAAAGTLNTPREEPVAAKLADGRVLFAGGYDPGSAPSYLRSAEIFNPATGSFSLLSSVMGARRDYAAAAPLEDGRVLIVGGDNGGSPALASAEVYNPATNSFSAVGSMGTPRSGPSAAPLPDGRVLVVGGNDGTTNLASAEVFNPATNSFSSTGIGSMAGPRLQAEATPLADGRVLVAGGTPNGVAFLSSAEIFAATNTFSFKVKGKKLIVNVQATGTVSVADKASSHRASAGKKKRKTLLKPSSASGDPPSITVPLKLSKKARKKLKQTGKVKVKARIVFTPQGGVANTRTAKLKIKRAKKK